MIIMSAYRRELDDVSNQSRHAALATAIMSLGYYSYQADGAYQGAPEKSLVIEASELDPILRGLMLKYDQDSVLLVDADNRASLIYQSGLVQHIGQWSEVTSLDGLPAYTSYLGRHYTAK